MGAEFNFAKLRSTNDKDALKEVSEMISEARYMHGHGGYTGTLAEARGCEIHRSYAPKCESEAQAWLCENANKWGPAIILRTPDKEYFVGALCSS